MPRRVSRKRGRRSYPRRPPFGRKKMRVSGSQKGYLRTGGLYGRFSGPRPELKFHDAIVGATFVGPNGTFLRTSHNVVSQGNGASQRIGRKITIRSFQVRGVYETRTTTVLDEMHQRVRMIFVVDKQTNGASPDLEDVFATNGIPTIDSFRDMANLARFSIIWDKTFNLPVLAATATAAAPVDRGFSFTKKMNLPIEYDDAFSSGVLSTQRTNNIFAIGFASHSQLQPAVRYIFRIRYTDS